MAGQPPPPDLPFGLGAVLEFNVAQSAAAASGDGISLPPSSLPAPPPPPPPPQNPGLSYAGQMPLWGAQTNFHTSTNPAPLTAVPAAATGGMSNSNLAQKQSVARDHTSVRDIPDPFTCHLCGRQVVLKDSMKNHMIGFHGYSKENKRNIVVWTKSQLEAVRNIGSGNILPKPDSHATNATLTPTRNPLALDLPASARVVSSSNLFDASKALPPLTVEKAVSQMARISKTSIIPAKRTHNMANPPTPQGSQHLERHPEEVTTAVQDGGDRTEDAGYALPGPDDVLPSIEVDDSYNSDPAFSAGWEDAYADNDVDTVRESARKLRKVARLGISLMPAESHERPSTDHELDEHLPERRLLSLDVPPRNTVERHNDTELAMLTQRQTEPTEPTEDEWQTETMQIEMPYGVIVVPKNFKRDNRLADIDRAEAIAAAQGHIEIYQSPDAERLLGVTPSNRSGMEATEMEDVDVWDDGNASELSTARMHSSEEAGEDEEEEAG